ncbi:hypothetical protein P691DRAFT_803369 [Macrolepiota fuliginosa MF-IS2]|uniref:Uncharacterized protein n=1 Tax=Macrolepiota fuliginosa MF-IS2 TaxID=1400762 RepID=A0A9P5X8W6_9AGAR|nr:hypothetical protein P691DRAFT_803369 [Macrolepiota fuliginosa MF-IS2]
MISDEQVAGHSIIIAFDIVAIIIITLLLLVIFTAACSRQVKRRLSWFNFMLPVMFYPASFLLLLGAQGHTQYSAPCTLQAVLIYSIPAYCATGFACFVLDFYLLLKETLHGCQPSKMTSRSLLVIPPVAFLSVLIADIVLILSNPDIGSQPKPVASGVYCHSESNIPTFLTAGVGAPALCTWFFVYVKTALFLRRHKLAIASYDKVVRSRISSIFIRTSLMSLATCVGIVLIIRATVVSSNLEQPYSVFQYLVFPLLIFSIFGTQTEFFKCWTCRRPTKAPQRETDKTGITSM